MIGVMDRGVVQGYLVVHYKKDGSVTEYEFLTSAEVHTCVREAEQDFGHHGFAFFTIIETIRGHEVEEGFMKRYTSGTRVYRKICRCLKHSWAPYHLNAHRDTNFVCTSCSDTRTLILKNYG